MPSVQAPTNEHDRPSESTPKSKRPRPLAAVRKAMVAAAIDASIEQNSELLKRLAK